MKRKIIASMFIVIFAVTMVFNISTSLNSNKIDIALANVEALAGPEIEIGPICVHIPPGTCEYEVGPNEWIIMFGRFI